MLKENSLTIISGLFSRVTSIFNLSAKVYDKYGAREFSGIAFEAKNNSGHLISDDSYIVEVLKNGGNDSINFWNWWNYASWIQDSQSVT